MSGISLCGGGTARDNQVRVYGMRPEGVFFMIYRSVSGRVFFPNAPMSLDRAANRSDTIDGDSAQGLLSGGPNGFVSFFMRLLFLTCLSGRVRIRHINDAVFLVHVAIPETFPPVLQLVQPWSELVGNLRTRS